MTTKTCPKGCGPMVPETIEKPMAFRGVELNVPVARDVCGKCGMTASDIAAAGAVQREIAEKYRQAEGLLTGKEIRSLRQAKNLTQEELAAQMRVGVASIKRWENANIQSRSMDNLLRAFLQNDCPEDLYTGNRSLSLPRVKLVIKHFESRLNQRLLKKTDKFLYVAKYLWYADMLAFRELGKSITGATYAALPYGPQLNNYAELVDVIKNAAETDAEPLSEKEIRIIAKVAERFPNQREIYEAAHRERIWEETPLGRMISYASAYGITEI